VSVVLWPVRHLPPAKLQCAIARQAPPSDGEVGQPEMLKFVIVCFVVALGTWQLRRGVSWSDALVWQTNSDIWQTDSDIYTEKHGKGSDKSHKKPSKPKKQPKKQPKHPKKPSKKLPPCRPPNPGTDDPSLKDVYARLERWNRFLTPAARVEKYCAMSQNAFRFFRGTNHLYWEDHAHDFRLWKWGGGRDFRTFLCGDLHPENFGTFHDLVSTLAYNINDFGTTILWIG